MPRLRRKSDIRAAALYRAALLREQADLRAAFGRSRTPSWHDVFLAALAEGRRVGAAARAAGMARSTVYKARVTDHRFDDAWHAAIARHPAPAAPQRADELTDAQLISRLGHGQRLVDRSERPDAIK